MCAGSRRACIFRWASWRAPARPATAASGVCRSISRSIGRGASIEDGWKEKTPSWTPERLDRGRDTAPGLAAGCAEARLADPARVYLSAVSDDPATMSKVLPMPGKPGPAPAPGTAFSPIDEILADLRAGRMVIILDDEDRENEGDLIMAAEHATPEAVAFMIRHTSGIICVPMLEDQLARLDLPQMVPVNSESHRTAFTVSVDLRAGTTHRGVLGRPCRNHPCACRSRHPGGRLRASRAHLPAARAPRRRAGARRAYRGFRGPVPSCGAEAGRRAVRDHERRWHDGAAPRAAGVRAPPPAEDGHDRRAHPPPAAQRALGGAPVRAERAHRAR